MDVVVTDASAHFVEHTRGLVASRPIEHNVLATVAATLEPTDSTKAPLFAWVEGAAGEVVGAALRTPPRPLLVSTMRVDAADALMPRLLEVDPELPGVTGPLPAASHVAQAWTSCAGGTVKPLMRQRIYWLEHVEEPARLPTGQLRPADKSDRDVMVDWTYAFHRDAGLPDVDVESEVDRRLRDGRMFVWSDGRGTVWMVGTGPPSPALSASALSTRPPTGVGTATPLPWSPTPADARWPPARRSACSTPTWPTRRPTASIKLSATAARATLRNTRSSATDLPAFVSVLGHASPRSGTKPWSPAGQT